MDTGRGGARVFNLHCCTVWAKLWNNDARSSHCRIWCRRALVSQMYNADSHWPWIRTDYKQFKRGSDHCSFFRNFFLIFPILFGLGKPYIVCGSISRREKVPEWCGDDMWCPLLPKYRVLWVYRRSSQKEYEIHFDRNLSWVLFNRCRTSRTVSGSIDKVF